MPIASLIISVVAIYFSVGLVFAIAFAVRGVERVDSAARGSSIAFRVTILPGTVALWPVLLMKWRKA